MTAEKPQFEYVECGSISRRIALQAISTVALGMMCGSSAARRLEEPIEEQLTRLETTSGGRLGVCILDTAAGTYVGHRLNERFGMCSTFKLPLAAIILREADRGTLRLDTPVAYSEDDMVFYASVTEKYLSEGSMTIAELAEAAQKTSDNVAANLLLDLLGGPPGFTTKLREIGDSTTRLDRYEPDMNLVPPGEVRDTTTPLAMAQTVARFFGDSLLSSQARKTLRAWMEETRTGMQRIRAGFPDNWRAGDKTGTGIADGMPNKYNDVAVVWPERGDEFVIAAYYEAGGADDKVRAEDEQVLQQVGEVSRGVVLSSESLS